MTIDKEMTSKTFKEFKRLYVITCLIVTIGLSIYSVSRYCKDEDSTVIKVRSFLGSKDTLYPSFSFCIMNPIIESKLDVYRDENINMTSYIKFLNGDFWDDRFLDVEYDNVTVSLRENLIEAMYKTHSRNIGVIDWKAEYFVSFRSPERKCFTIKAPFPDEGLLHHSWLKIKKDIFPV